MSPPGTAVKLTTASYFLIDVSGISTIGAFMSCSGLGLDHDVLTYHEGGNNDFAYHLPGPINYRNLVLTRGLTDQDALTSWLEATQTEPQLKDVTITFQDSKKKSLRKWVFVEAFPIRWQGPTFDANSQSFATEELEIVHSGLRRA